MLGYTGTPAIFGPRCMRSTKQYTLLMPDNFLWKLPICGDSQAAIQLQIVQGHILGLSAQSEVYTHISIL